MIFPEFTNYLQTSVSYVFLVLAKWGIYHTHIGPSNRSVVLYKAPSVKSRLHSPHYFIKKTQPKSVSSVISLVVLTDTCVLCFSILVSVDPWNAGWYDISQNGGWHTNLSCILDTWILFLFLCFWQNTHGTKFSYILISHCLLWHVPSMFSWLVDGACLPCLAVETLEEEGS